MKKIHFGIALFPAVLLALAVSGCSADEMTTQYDVTAEGGNIAEVSFSTVTGSDPETPNAAAWSKQVSGYGVSTVTATPDGDATLQCSITDLTTGEVVAEESGQPGEPVECEAVLTEK